LHNNSGKISYN